MNCPTNSFMMACFWGQYGGGAWKKRDGPGLYAQKDTLNVLRATHIACEGPTSLAIELLGEQTAQAVLDAAGGPIERPARDKELLRIYRRGFCTALSSVALWPLDWCRRRACCEDEAAGPRFARRRVSTRGLGLLEL
jgi:hypothetical protein